MNQASASSCRLNRSLALVGLLALCFRSGQAADLSEIKVYSDTSIPANERIQSLVGLLNEEVRSPTRPRAGWGGGQIDHDYTVAQIALALSRVAEETEGGRENLRQAMALADIPESRDAIVIALGLTGDSSMSPQLVEMLKKPDQPNRRALSASALGMCEAVLYIPDLAEALSDRHARERGGDVGESHGEDYPVRRAASLALRSMGVGVKHPDPAKECGYEVDAESAVKVVEPLLRNSENANAAQAIQAIRRIGGTAARDALQRFVVENQGKEHKQELVRAANAALSSIVESVTNVPPRPTTPPAH